MVNIVNFVGLPEVLSIIKHKKKYLVKHLFTKSRAPSEKSSESCGIANEPLPIAKIAAIGGISDLKSKVRDLINILV